MKHILDVDQFLNEDEKQMFVLFFPSAVDIRGRSHLPSRWDSQGTMIATFPMIQDAVRYMDEEGLPYLYQVVVQARILTEPELYLKLSEKGFNPEDIVDTLEQEGRLPQSLTKTDLADLLWYWHGFEVGDKVWVGDLSQIAGSMHAVMPTEIERIKRKIGILENHTISKIELTDEIKQTYLQELGRHVSHPQILQKNPGEWQAIVNFGEPPETRIRGLAYTVPQLAKLTRDHSAKVWGTPQAAFDNFYGWVSDLGGDEDEWGDLHNYTIDDYMQMSGKSREIAILMKAVYDGFEAVEWIEVK